MAESVKLIVVTLRHTLIFASHRSKNARYLIRSPFEDMFVERSLSEGNRIYRLRPRQIIAELVLHSPTKNRIAEYSNMLICEALISRKINQPA